MTNPGGCGIPPPPAPPPPRLFLSLKSIRTPSVSFSITPGSGSYGMLKHFAISITYFSTNNFGGLWMDSLCLSFELIVSFVSLRHDSAYGGPYLADKRSAMIFNS